MKIIENHFEGKTTYIFGDYVGNGCQAFHIHALGPICDRFGVPEEIRKQVCDAWVENKSANDDPREMAKNMDLPVLLLSHLIELGFIDPVMEDHPNEVIRHRAFISTKNWQKAAKDKDAHIRARAVRHIDNWIDLKDDTSAPVICALIERGHRDPSYVRHLSPSVRLAMAGAGEHLDIYFEDPQEKVRAAVAKNGKYLDILVNDSSARVRCICTDHHQCHAALMKDEIAYIRNLVLCRTEDISIMMAFLEDADFGIRLRAARQIVTHTETTDEQKAIAEKVKAAATEELIAWNHTNLQAQGYLK